MMLKRFDVVLVDFGSDVIGSEQGGLRPALVIQNNIGNLHSDTTIVMPCTSKKKNLFQPTHTLLKKSKKSGLSTDSVLLGECIRQISKERVKKHLGSISDPNEKEENGTASPARASLARLYGIHPCRDAARQCAPCGAHAGPRR